MTEYEVTEGAVIEKSCSECGQETEQEVLEIKSDGSGFTRCSSCESLVVCMAGSFPQGQ